jgi:hypothetical protein
MSKWGKGSITLNVVVVLAIYFGLAEWLKSSFTDPTPRGGVVVLLSRPFEKHGDFGAASYELRSLPPFLDNTDQVDGEPRSPLLLYENGRLLGPAHSSIADVGRLGMGRYVHSNLGLVFSASDNTDPNVNGRHYWAVMPQKAIDTTKRS